MDNNCPVTISGDDALQDLSEGSECGTSHAVVGPLVHLPQAFLIFSDAYSMVPRMNAVAKTKDVTSLILCPSRL